MTERVKRISEGKLAKLITDALRKSDYANVLTRKARESFGEGVAAELYHLWSDEDGRNFSQEDTMCVLGIVGDALHSIHEDLMKAVYGEEVA